MAFTAEQLAKSAETRRRKAEARRAAGEQAAPPELEVQTRVQVEQMPPVSAPPVEQPQNQQDLLRLIQDLSKQVQDLTSKVQKNTPQFRPIERPLREATPGDHRAIAAGLAGGQAREGVDQLPVGARGLSLRPEVFYEFQQYFQPGDRVRINPEVTREGANRTWGEIIDKVGEFRCLTKTSHSGTEVRCPGVVRINETCPRCGSGPRVKAVRYLSQSGQWKYVVRVPGLTNNNGDGFHQNELMNA